MATVAGAEPASFSEGLDSPQHTGARTPRRAQTGNTKATPRDLSPHLAESRQLIGRFTGGKCDAFRAPIKVF